MKQPLPKCPCCGRNKTVVNVGVVGDMLRCSQCGLFDTDPDEGGTHSNFNPAARLERAERKQQRHSHR